MWQTKYASAIHKNLGVGFNFRTCIEEDVCASLFLVCKVWFHFSTLLCTFCDKNGHKLLKIATFSSWLMSIHTYLILSYKKTIRWIYSFPRGSRSEKKVGTSRIEGRGIPHAIPSCSALGSLSLYFFTFCKIFFILDIFLKGIKDDVYAQCSAEASFFKAPFYL